MSQWTHVAACIRFDGLRLPGFPNMKPDVSIGLPEGSEGELDVTWWENPMREAMAAWTVTIHGDLRDFGGDYARDVGSILDYLNRICTSDTALRPIMVRQGICQVEVEYKPTMVLMWVASEAGQGRWHSIYETTTPSDLAAKPTTAALEMDEKQHLPTSEEVGGERSLSVARVDMTPPSGASAGAAEVD